MANLKNTNIDNNLELPQGTTAQRPASPQEGQIRYNTDTGVTEFYNGANWRPLSDTHPEATGGTVVDTDIGGVPYRIHYFTETGTDTLTVTNPSAVDVLIVAGGGGGGGSTSSSTGSGGGGGAGGVILKENYFVEPGSYTVAVGSGGAGTETQGINGSDSSVFGLTALGGGGGGFGNGTDAGNDGGSGGGGGGDNGFAAGGTGLQPTSASGGFGNDGGAATTASGDEGGGGGGAGSAGLDGRSSVDRPPSGPGGQGIDVSKYFGFSIGDSGIVGGGGAGHADDRNGGLIPGGLGGGGDFNDDTREAFPGQANTGGGGAGGGKAGPRLEGEDGGSGIVIVRYPRNSSLDSEPDRTVIATQPNRFQTMQDDLVLELDAANPLSYPGTGTTWFDISGNNHHAFGQDSSGNSVSNSDFPTFENENGGRFRFDNKALIIPSNMGDHTQGTHEIWFYRNTNDSSRYIADARNGTGSWWIADYQSNDNIDIHGQLEADNPVPHTNNSAWWFRWLHVVIMSNDNTNSRLFIDGKEVLSPNLKDNSPLNINLGSDFSIGARYTGSSRWIGWFSVYRIYNRELSEQEIQQNFNATRGRYGI